MNMRGLMACAMAATLALGGCQQSEELGGGNESHLVTIMGGQSGYEPAATRSVIGGELENGALVMQWAVEDKIGVFSTSAQNSLFTSTNTSPANYTGFVGTKVETETLEYAYYPYAEGVTDRTRIPVNIPSMQSYTDVNSVAQYDLKASDQLTEQTDGTYECQMKQMACLVRFEINLHNVADEIQKQDENKADASGEKLLSVSIHSNVNLTGSYTYDLTHLSNGLVPVQDSGDLTLNFTATPSLSGTVVAYAVVAPGKQNGQKLTINIETNKHKLQLTPTVLCDFEAGSFYVIPLNATVFTNNKVTVETSYPEVTEETANCYMVTQTGEHSFVATQIGNGDKGIVKNAQFHVTSTRILPSSAKLLWQDTQNFVSDIRLTDGRVYYKANSNVGNAVIAVYSGENGTGDILWSWHIWGVGDKAPADVEITNRANAKFQMMDRVLGSLSAVSTSAMLYQWGRKDPIPNASAYYVDGKSVDISTSFPVTDGTGSTILTGVRNPASIIKPESLPGDWLTTANNYLWGDVNENDQYTWYSNGKYANAGAGADWTDQKTIYDPSPVGYRVANKFTFTGFAVNNSGETPQGNTTSKLGYINYVKYENDGWYFKKNSTDTEGVYFPMTGSRGAGSGSLWVGSGKSAYNTVGYTASYWASAINKNAGQSSTLAMEPHGTENTSSSNNSYNSLKTVDCSYRANAYAVRCVRENQ